MAYVQLTIAPSGTFSLFIHFYLVMIYSFQLCYTFLILLVGGWGTHSNLVRCSSSVADHRPLQAVSSRGCTTILQGTRTVGSLHQVPARVLLNLQSSGSWWRCTERRPSLPETWRPGWVWNLGCSLLQHRVLFYLKSERNSECVIPAYYFCSCCLKKIQVLKPIYQLYLTSSFHLVVTVFSIWDAG